MIQTQGYVVLLSIQKQDAASHMCSPISHATQLDIKAEDEQTRGSHVRLNGWGYQDACCLLPNILDHHMISSSVSTPSQIGRGLFAFVETPHIVLSCGDVCDRAVLMVH